MRKEILQQVSIVQEHELQKIDRTSQKSISYSQLLSYSTCPHQWANSYIRNLQEYKPSIHTCFGTAFHETLQEWLTVLYEESIKKSSEMDLDTLLMEKMQQIYAKEKDRYGQHFSNSQELSDFHSDGVEILKFIRKKRASYFSNSKTHLVGVEIPLLYEVSKNIFFKGFIDVVLYNENSDSYTVIDIKTSTSGWNSYAKKDSKKLAQLLLYKVFLAKQFGLDVEKVDVQYFIVKRKVPVDPEYPAMGRRVQEFVPSSGKIKRGQVVASLQKFLGNAFSSDGKYVEKEYEKVPSKSNCMFCSYKSTEHCNAHIVL